MSRTPCRLCDAVRWTDSRQRPRRATTGTGRTAAPRPTDGRTVTKSGRPAVGVARPAANAMSRVRRAAPGPAGLPHRRAPDGRRPGRSPRYRRTHGLPSPDCVIRLFPTPTTPPRWSSLDRRRYARPRPGRAQPVGRRRRGALRWLAARSTAALRRPRRRRPRHRPRVRPPRRAPEPGAAGRPPPLRAAPVDRPPGTVRSTRRAGLPPRRRPQPIRRPADSRDCAVSCRAANVRCSSCSACWPRSRASRCRAA